ncbi:MAG: hypothetical protein H0V19_03060, partial [Euzebyales bacterium]|nr:hypothetical protein [Euzebyales bacterium]
MDSVAVLLRRERLIAAVRWLALVFVSAQALLWRPPGSTGAGGRPPGTWMPQAGLLAALLLVAVAVEVALHGGADAARLRRVGNAAFAGDTA